VRDNSRNFAAAVLSTRRGGGGSKRGEGTLRREGGGGAVIAGLRDVRSGKSSDLPDGFLAFWC